MEVNIFNWKDFPSNIDLHLLARELMVRFTKE